ncbi:aspartate aminotransferase family protein [Streptomyces sp. BHT-5-2]|uniref:aspartate aminotransferase family protein n=2 Tax=unclassified Streptomyces TaxID=2593676 RepID=UPI0021B0AFB7|nr:aminotransferase class III-fold pyridoxal phosphate-dependent enzyme [Streptomyces sp. BHT-5-2]
MSSNTPATDPSGTNTAELSEPYMTGLLSSLGLAVEYVRATGNTLYRRDEAGEEKAVLDMVGGYGSTILGHNNPDVLGYAKSLLEAHVPVHAQFASHPHANDVARKLNAILQRELGGAEPYFAVFANTGAEAVEVAVKHAELDRVKKVAALRKELEEGLEQAGSAVADGAAALTDTTFEELDALGVPAAHGTGIDHLLDTVKRLNEERVQTPPVLLALQGSFHGKLIGSVQLTHNPSVRLPFQALAGQCRFVPVDQPDALAQIVKNERRTLLGLAVANGVVHVAERDLPNFCAFLLEPIQGEAGINVLDEEAARRIQRTCAAIDCPVIIDEVQSGMGRSGAFFASSSIGIRGDYYTLSKSLGGGIAKASIALIRGSRYRTDFELMHSSTFAKDGFSTLIAGKVIDLLEQNDGEAYRLAEERGNRLLSELRAIHADFPDVVKEVRGKGLMIGMEFHDQSDAPSAAIREQASLFGYVAAGYLLRTHSLRVFPTASAVNTLRFEPSIHLTDAEIDQVATALRDLCTVLHTRDDSRLFGV